MPFFQKILARKKIPSAALTKLKPIQRPIRPPQLAMKLMRGSLTDLSNLEQLCIFL